MEPARGRGEVLVVVVAKRRRRRGKRAANGTEQILNVSSLSWSATHRSRCHNSVSEDEILSSLFSSCAVIVLEI
jgi:hypothetical protein